jgi:hypothetical protein
MKQLSLHALFLMLGIGLGVNLREVDQDLTYNERFRSATFPPFKGGLVKLPAGYWYIERLKTDVVPETAPRRGHDEPDR